MLVINCISRPVMSQFYHVDIKSRALCKHRQTLKTTCRYYRHIIVAAIELSIKMNKSIDDKYIVISKQNRRSVVRAFLVFDRNTQEIYHYSVMFTGMDIILFI